LFVSEERLEPLPHALPRWACSRWQRARYRSVAGRGPEGIPFPGDDHDRQVDGVEESLETVAGRSRGGAAQGTGHRPGDASSTKVAGRGLVDGFGGAIESGVENGAGEPGRGRSTEQGRCERRPQGPGRGALEEERRDQHRRTGLAAGSEVLEDGGSAE
jgi:hypothetical protein